MHKQGTKTMWPLETIYPPKKQRKHKDSEAPALQRKEIKDPHPLNTLRQRPTTPLFKLQNKEAHYPIIQTYNKTKP